MSGIWTERYELHTFELDSRQRLSVQGLCNFLVDAAGHNVDSLGYSIPELQKQGKSWFLARLLLRVRRYPGWKEQLTVQTWPSGMHRLFALREWRLFCGGAEIAVVTSAWLLVDLASRRPLRPESLPGWREATRPERAIPYLFDKLPPLEPTGGPTEQEGFRVRFGDLDINGHATYLSYVDWLLESVPPGVRGTNRVRELEIHFQAETEYGAHVLSRSVPLPGESPGFLHSLAHREDGTELARGRTFWSPLEEGADAAGAAAGGSP
jgi:medium-chain acyl-[acyl-carrier-protein] hydrolase